MAKKKTFWWMRVNDPDKVIREAAAPVSNRYVRNATIMRRAGMFRNNPAVARALVEANVPMALAMRSFETVAARAAQTQVAEVKRAGYSTHAPSIAHQAGTNLATPAPSAPLPTAPEEEEEGGLWNWLGNRAADVGTFFKVAGEGALTGLTYGYNRVVGAPLAAGFATESGLDRALAPEGDRFEGLSSNPLLGAIQFMNRNTGAGIAAAVGAPINYGEGVYRNITGDISEEQRTDIRRAGLNPDDAGDRVSFYSQDYGEQMAPVSDEDVRWLKGLGKYRPEDVDAAREVITRGALEDVARSFPALSPNAQQFLLRASSEPQVAELLEGMADGSQVAFGGRLVRATLPDETPGEAFGPGGTGRAIAATIADVVATWHLDPFVVAAKGIQAGRAARFGVNMQSADKLDQTAQMMKASDEAGKPKGFMARRFEQAMEVADRIVHAQSLGDEGLVQAAKMRDRWSTAHPGYGATLDLLIGMRNGSVGAVNVRTGARATKDTKLAAAQGRNPKPWAIEAPGDGKPLFRFTNEDGSTADQLARAEMRAKVADELATFVFMEAAASGRPFVGSNVLLPGRISINGAIRARVAPVMEAITRRDRSYFKQLADTGVKPISIDEGVSTDAIGRFEELISPESNQWMRKNYTFGITHMFARAWRNIEKTYSNRVLVESSPDSVQVYSDLVSSFMPKRQAQIATTVYAGANPAERWMMTRQTLGSMFNVMRLRDTPEAQRLVENISKGLIPTDELFESGYRVGERQKYTTPDGNDIRVGELKMPAAVHAWQLDEGTMLPNFREVRELLDKGKLYNAFTNTVMPSTDAFITMWKSLKVSSWANMFRQATELFTFSTGLTPGAVKGYRQARKAVKGDVKLRRVNDRDLERLANKMDRLDAEDLDQLETVRRRDPETFVSTLTQMLGKNGFNPGLTEVLARMAVHADVTEWVAQLKSPGAARVQTLAFMGLFDAHKRIRAERMIAKGKPLTDSPLSRYLDDETSEALLQAGAKQLGSAAQSYGWSSFERGYQAVRDRITDAAGQGISFRPVKINNGYKWVKDFSGDAWASEIARRMSDPASAVALRFLAARHLRSRASDLAQDGMTLEAIGQEQADVLSKVLRTEALKKVASSELKTMERADQARQLMLQQAVGRKNSKAWKARQDKLDALGHTKVNGKDWYGPTPDEINDAKTALAQKISEIDADQLFDAQLISDPDTLLTTIFDSHALGQPMREQAARMQFLPDGTPVANDADRYVAAEQAAFTAVNDLIHHLGGKPLRSSDPATGTKTLDAQFGAGSVDQKALSQLDKVMEKIRDGFSPGADDLQPLINAGIGPEGLVVPLHAPMLAGKEGFSNKLANFSSRMYDVIVAGPLERLGLLPLFIANRRIALGELEPLMEELVKKGLSHGDAAYLVENTANQRALNLVFRGTDNPMDKTVFAEMVDKWMPFTRAQFDFLRRVGNATVIKPEALARGHILLQAATQAGIVHYEPMVDEEGNTEYNMTFTYPGTAAAQRVLADAFVSLGWAPEEMLRIPQFDGLKSQVRFINPGVSNPFGFSANPIFGYGIEVAGALWPRHEIAFERIKKSLSGGTDYEGKVGISDPGSYALHQFTPSMLHRFIPLLTSSNAESAFQASMRAGAMYAEAAGLGPGSDASPAERALFVDAVKATTTNVLIQRAILGSFLPASPSVADPDIPLDPIARIQGLSSLRSEFFDIRKEMTEKYPDDFVRADAEATVEFARRYPGELIVNPGAFSVGSTETPGSGGVFVPYTIQATQWVLDNKEFVDANPLIALALLPESVEAGAFSNEAYRLQFKADIRTNKGFEKFLTDLTIDSDLTEFFAVTKEYSTRAKQTPGLAKSVYNKRDQWENAWRRAHPLAAAELDRRSDPNFVHAEVVPALVNVIRGEDPIPEKFREFVPAMEEMIHDYQDYRRTFEGVSYYDNSGRSRANTAYRNRGDQKWLGTPLERMWNLMRVSEGY